MFSRNVAQALAVLIGIGPWLVLAGLLVALLRFTWRRLRRKPQVSGA
jgi:glycerol-3-phosphate acyltransferase PlsY